MEEFKPDNGFRPDASDRRLTRSSSARVRKRSSFSYWKRSVSREHLMLAVGILILLLLVLGIGSALKGPAKRTADLGEAREINLPYSGSDHLTGKSPSVENAQESNAPPVSPMPTEAAPLTQSGQQRVELPGDIADTVNQQQDILNTLSQGATEPVLPTGDAILAPNIVKAPSGVKENRPSVKPFKSVDKTITSGKGSPSEHAGMVAQVPRKSVADSTRSTVGNVVLSGVPVHHFTLQLSGASRADTLNAFAKKNNLSHYWVYETRREGKPWYVLISGNYATSADAKNAVASLPLTVQATKPWVKPIWQVQKELKKK